PACGARGLALLGRLSYALVMRTTILAASLLLASSSVSGTMAPVAPCTSSVGTTCQVWVTLGGGPSRSMVYSTYPLTTKNDAIRRALIMVHGTNRNADHYFETATAAAFLAGALGDAIVIPPRIPANPGG